MNANELNYLPGYYVCECGESYLSDFPFKNAHCPCGNELDIFEITEDELSGILYNMDILSRSDNGEGYTWSQVAEFLHYFDHIRMSLLIDFLQKNGYLSYNKTKKCISDITVHEMKVRVKAENVNKTETEVKEETEHA